MLIYLKSMITINYLTVVKIEMVVVVHQCLSIPDFIIILSDNFNPSTSDLRELLYIELTNCKCSSQNILIGNIYRPCNGNVNDFLNYLTSNLNMIHSEKICYLNGDININLLVINVKVPF